METDTTFPSLASPSCYIVGTAVARTTVSLSIFAHLLIYLVHNAEMEATINDARLPIYPDCQSAFIFPTDFVP